MPRKRILIVEDEDIVAEQLRQSLTAEGYDIVGVAHSGEQAVDEGGGSSPTWVIMDIVLTGQMDGISAAQRLQPLGIPVVYLTAYTDRHLLDLGTTHRAAGVCHETGHDRVSCASYSAGPVQATARKETRARWESANLPHGAKPMNSSG